MEQCKKHKVLKMRLLIFTLAATRRGSRGGGALGRAPTPGTEGPAPSSQGQKEGTLVSLEWLFNTIQA